MASARSGTSAARTSPAGRSTTSRVRRSIRTGIYASQTSGWFGQIIQRSDDGGKTWEPVGNEFVYDGVPGTHQWYDGTPHPWEFKRVWHLEPSLTDPDTVYAGVEDAALFRIDRRRPDLARARRAARPRLGPAVAARRGRHGPAHDPARPDATRAGSSSPSRPRAPSAPTTAATTWTADQPRPQVASTSPIPNAEVGHCVHRIAMHPSRPNVLFMQKHWDVMRSDDAGDSWHEVSGNLPTDFGFPIDVHAHEPETDLRRADQERLRALPARRASSASTAAAPAATSGRRSRRACRRRTATSTCCATRWPSTRSTPCGIYFGTTGGQVYASADGGDSWAPIVRDLPAVLSVEVQTLP